MGFDIEGQKPKSEVGQYFRSPIHWWPDLWEYCLRNSYVASEYLGEAGFYNGSGGLNATESERLAKDLENAIADGRFAEYLNDIYRAPCGDNELRLIAFLKESGGFEIW